jgi:hypothetical protein
MTFPKRGGAEQQRAQSGCRTVKSQRKAEYERFLIKSILFSREGQEIVRELEREAKKAQEIWEVRCCT